MGAKVVEFVRTAKRKLCITLFIAVLISTAIIINKAYSLYETVTNGGFETGDLARWSTNDPKLVAVVQSFQDISGNTYNPRSGKYCAKIDDGAYLEYNFPVPVQATDQGLIFWIWGGSLRGYTDVTITFSDHTHFSYQVVDKSAWHEWNVALITPISEGKLVSRIAFEPYRHDDTFAIYLDDVSVPANMKFDLNGDGCVDILDLTLVAKAFKCAPGDPNWNALADVNNDGTINIFDISSVALYYGKTV